MIKDQGSVASDQKARNPAATGHGSLNAGHSIGHATEAFNVPYAGGLLTYRAGQRIVAHPELRRLIETHRFPVRFEED